jgi:hypothetical protein
MDLFAETETHSGSCRLVGFQSRVVYIHNMQLPCMLLYIIRFQPSLYLLFPPARLQAQVPTAASNS